MKSPKFCLGFGEKENTCENAPGGHRSPYFCVDCDKARIAHIDKQLKALSVRVGEAIA